MQVRQQVYPMVREALPMHWDKPCLKRQLPDTVPMAVQLQVERELRTEGGTEVP